MSGPKQTPGRARHKGNPSTFCAKEFKIVALRDCPLENLSISEAIIETIRAWKDGSLVEGFIHMELNRYFGTAVHQDDFNHALKRLRADKKLRRIGRSSRMARWALPKTGSAR